jgi:hypothetical protein
MPVQQFKLRSRPCHSCQHSMPLKLICDILRLCAVFGPLLICLVVKARPCTTTAVHTPAVPQLVNALVKTPKHRTSAALSTSKSV